MYINSQQMQLIEVDRKEYLVANINQLKTKQIHVELGSSALTTNINTEGRVMTAAVYEPSVNPSLVERTAKYFVHPIVLDAIRTAHYRKGATK